MDTNIYKSERTGKLPALQPAANRNCVIMCNYVENIGLIYTEIQAGDMEVYGSLLCFFQCFLRLFTWFIFSFYTYIHSPSWIRKSRDRICTRIRKSHMKLHIILKSVHLANFLVVTSFCFCWWTAIAHSIQSFIQCICFSSSN